MTAAVRICTIYAILLLLACSEADTGHEVAAISRPTSLTPEMLGIAEAVGTGDYAYQTVEHLSHNFGSQVDEQGRRHTVMAGSKAAHETAEWIAAEMKRIGLQEVASEPYPIHAYELNGSSLTNVETGETFPTTAMAQTPPTPPEGLQSQLIDVGNGLRSDYDGKDVVGKIVLLSFDWSKQFYFNAAMFEAKKRGATGIVYDFIGRQVIDDALYSYPLSPFHGQTIPALNVSHNTVDTLREDLARGDVIISMKLDAVDAFEGTDHNIIGYIKGRKFPDELIVIGDHFDHYFYGSLDCGTCVGSVLGLAKAFIDSGYEPDRTLVFVAHGAEENGWHTPWGPYINGAWNLIANSHPDWAGRAVAFLGWDWSGDINSKSVHTNTYTNELHSLISELKPTIDEYFSNQEPWSDYYRPMTIPEDGGLSHQGWDALAYSNRGVPVFSLSAGQQDPKLPSAYHTQFDDMSRISGEAMSMGMIASAIAVVALDRNDVTPYDFTTWTRRLKAKLEEDRSALGAHDIGLSAPFAAINSVEDIAGQLATQAVGPAELDPDKSARINHLQREVAIGILPHMYYSAGDFPYASYWRHTQYLRDANALLGAIQALESNDTEGALEQLLKVTSAWYGSNVSWEVHRAWVDFEPEVLFSDSLHGPRIPRYLDVWHEVEALKAALQGSGGEIADTPPSELSPIGDRFAGTTRGHNELICSLREKYEVTQVRLEEAVHEMMLAVVRAEAPLAEAQALLASTSENQKQ